MGDLSAEVLVQLIRHLGHDIRAPLGSVISTADMLAAEVYGPISEKQAKAAERMRRTGQRSLTIIDDFVTFVKAEAGELVLAATIFQPHTLLTECCEVVRPEAEKKGLMATLDAPPDSVPPLVGDAAAVKRVVLALLWNAVAFTSSGVITVMSGWDESGAGWWVTVQDTGGGISMLDAPFIFDPFWRGIERPQVPTAGAGLGLAVGRALAHQMGGTLVLKETSPTGSNFRLEVPLKAAVADNT